MKKKITAVALVIAILAIGVIGGTLAYFTDTTEAATNTFTVGNVAIELTETQWTNSASKVAPGDVYAKDPTVNNTGNNDAWVRVNVTLSDAAAFQTACATHQITDLTTIFGGHDDTKWTLAGTSTKDDTLTYSYYFNTPVAPAGTTGALFTSVTIPAAFTEAEMAELDADFTITITADAIQTYAGTPDTTDTDDGFTTAAEAFEAFDTQNP